MSDRRNLLLSEMLLRCVGALAHYDLEAAERLFRDSEHWLDEDYAGVGRRFFADKATGSRQGSGGAHDLTRRELPVPVSETGGSTAGPSIEEILQGLSKLGFRMALTGRPYVIDHSKIGRN